MCLMSSAAMTLNLHKSPLKLVSPGAIARCWTLVAASGRQPAKFVPAGAVVGDNFL